MENRGKLDEILQHVLESEDEITNLIPLMNLQKKSMNLVKE